MVGLALFAAVAAPSPSPLQSAPDPPPSECAPKDLPMGGGRLGSAQIQGPKDVSAAGVAAWMSNMRAMRTACDARIGFDPNNASRTLYNEPELLWTQTAYMGPQMHPYDKYFYNESLGNGTNGAGYTVDLWLADLNARYGGIDKALVWPTYTNIGIDDRNTWELIRSMPGGTEGIRVVVAQLKAKGVRVLWPYHPWDHSTHDQQRNNVTDFEAMAQLLKDTGADGFNADTMHHIPRDFLEAATKIYKPIAMEAEAGIPEFDIPYVTLGWAEGWVSNEGPKQNGAWTPDVDKAKWLSFGKAMTTWCARWTGDPQNTATTSGKTSKIAELQAAYFNGLGFETWENVWGTWNGITPRFGEAIRRMGLLLRYFGQRRFLQSSGWMPHTTEALQMDKGVFASAFPREVNGQPNSSSETVYLLVNRDTNKSSTGATLAPRYVEGNRYYDCYNGVELTLASDHTLSFTIEASGFGCVLSTPNTTEIPRDATSAEELRTRGGTPAVPATLGDLLKTMHTLTAKPLSAFNATWEYLPQEVVAWDQPTTPLRPPNTTAPGEVYVAGAANYHWTAKGVELEGGNSNDKHASSGVGEQMPWEAYPRRSHDKVLRVGAMYVDKHPVTNTQYAEYLKKTGYTPSDRLNWLLRNFDFNGETPAAPKSGWEQRPVTYVSLKDARAYCSHFGRRLPHTHEWQYIAQGGNSTQKYPWGDADDASRTSPVNNDYVNPGPGPVGQYPNGSSSFGVEDLVRSVWQYTTSFEDIHTRSIVLRGSANYGPWRGHECRWIENDDGTLRTVHPNCAKTAAATPVPGSTPHLMGGSKWYFPPAYDLTTYGKYFLMGGAYERAGTVGFRCVADAS